jgi:signal peptidase I
MVKKIIGAVIIAVVRIIALFALWQINARQIEFKTVISGSMSPAINTGDVVAIEKVNISGLKAGDIITFGHETTYTTHRIMNVTAEGFLTKGDANEDPDISIVKREEVLGKVIFTIPYLGYLGAFVRTPIGFAIFILIPGALIIISEVLKIRGEVGKKKVPRLEYRPKDHNVSVHTSPHAHAIRHAKWTEKKIDPSRYESLQEELEGKKEPEKD